MSKSGFDNVHFLGVARVAGQGIVIASFDHNSETDLGGVKQVLEQPNMQLSPGKHYSFSVGDLAWHLIADEKDLIYILISALNYPQRCGHSCLEKLQSTFLAECGNDASTAGENQLSTQCRPLFQKICIEYDDLVEVDKLTSENSEVDSVQLTIEEDVIASLKNCVVKMKSIERQAVEDFFGYDDDDDDDDDAVTSTSRPISNQSASITNNGGDLFDSDDEHEPIQKKMKTKLTKNANRSTKKTGGSTGNNNELFDSSDDEDVKATVDDYLFIDSDDEENKEVMKEYRSEKQNFHEERENKKRKFNESKPKKNSADDTNPLMLTLADMQSSKRKAPPLNDEQKSSLSTQLLQQMDRAYKEDEYLHDNDKTALKKLILLPTVVSMCNLRPLQQTLLEYDILSSIRAWVEPIDQGKTLPSLSLRTAMYDVLLALPAQSDHLKRSGIGKTIVALRKHKLESMENKRKLKAIMEKWCRPIFNKSTDSRTDTRDRITEAQHDIARARQIEKMRELNVKQQENKKLIRKSISNDANATVDEQSVLSTEGASTSSSQAETNPLTSMLEEEEVIDHRQRVRTPYTTGFYFTVRPENKAPSSTNRAPERDVSIDTETGDVIRSRGTGRRNVQEENYHSKLNKQILELNKHKGVMGGGVKKQFKIEVK